MLSFTLLSQFCFQWLCLASN